MTGILIGIILYAIVLFLLAMSKANKPKFICKKHTWREVIVEMPIPEDNVRMMYCSVCGLLPSADIENPNFIEIDKMGKWK